MVATKELRQLALRKANLQTENELYRQKVTLEWMRLRFEYASSGKLPDIIKDNKSLLITLAPIAGIIVARKFPEIKRAFYEFSGSLNLLKTISRLSGMLCKKRR
ncbi:MAG: hypothetical protein K9N48_05655 [Verrucomicrobia bacterium]|nr:hypothetical protein [Verrucomicrobiota bacterium]MCF7709323.1 hypothetical protein [Verrucomicrobiota bacterium]